MTDRYLPVITDQHLADSLEILRTFEAQKREIERLREKILQLEGALHRLWDHHEAAITETDIALVQTSPGDKIREPILRMLHSLMVARGIARRALGMMPPAARSWRPSLRLVSENAEIALTETATSHGA